jgi:protease-4
MSFDPDRLLDRRRLKRGVTAWRAVAIAALVALVVVAVGRFGVDGLRGREHVVRLWVDGIIVEEPEREAALADLADDANVKAVIVRINSPGGTAVGGETLYLNLRRVGVVKPVVAVLGTTATSAGYMVALAADRIFTREATLTGSIGVVFQTAEFTRLLDDLGITPGTAGRGDARGFPRRGERHFRSLCPDGHEAPGLLAGPRDGGRRRPCFHWPASGRARPRG